MAIFGITRALGGDADTADPTPSAAPGDDDAQTATADPTSTEDAADETAAPECEEDYAVTVLASPDIEPVITQIADGLACTTVTVEAQPSLEVAALMAGGEAPEAQVWIPSSPAFAAALADAGVSVEVGPVVATSPVVLAAERSVFEESTANLAEEPTWADLVTAELPLVVGDPQQDPATMATLLSAHVGLGDSDAARALTSSLMVKLAQNAVADPLAAVQGGGPIFAPTTASQVVASTGSDHELVGLTPRGGAGLLSYPYVVLPGAAEAPGVAELREALLAPEAAAVFEAGGLAAGDGAATTPDAEAVQALIQEWTTLQPPSRLLAVIDVSGSMDEKAGEASRIQITSQAAERGLGLFPDDSAVGLWVFSTNRGPDDEDFVEVLPVRQLTTDVDGKTQRELLQEASSSMDEDMTTGDTGLHDTILAAYLHMQGDWQDGFVSSIVLLTDGVNDDSTGGLSEDELIAELGDLADPERPVRLILIGMGPDVDSSALERVAQAAGGVAYTAEDPRDIGQVFVQAIAARQG
nr:substrate-binding domain-containing protein [Ornithinimicrobium cryptoxanthini]